MITGQDYAAVAVLSAEDERCHSPETPGCAEGCLVLMSVYDLSEQHGRVRVSVPHFTVLMGQGGRLAEVLRGMPAQELHRSSQRVSSGY